MNGWLYQCKVDTVFTKIKTGNDFHQPIQMYPSLWISRSNWAAVSVPRPDLRAEPVGLTK